MTTNRNIKVRPELPLFLVLAILFIVQPTHAVTYRTRGNLGNFALYESNIYHSYDDSLETGAFLNSFNGEFEWKIRQSRRVRHRIRIYTSLDLYPSYSDRNQTAFGIRYEPYWKYSRNGKFTLDFEISRRNKDLIDDAGQVLARTLQKWNTDIELTHEHRTQKLNTELAVKYARDNYDEVAGATSYDYKTIAGRARVEYELTKKLTGRVTLDLDRRKYDARRTYTVQYGAYVGRPFEIRKYTLTDLELAAIYAIGSESSLKFDYNWARRKENFENFYGYDYWQAKVSADLQLAANHAIMCSFRYKDKRYDNYWNSSIGLLNRVWVEYADFQFEYHWLLSESAKLIAYTNNYNKVSNYHAADYQDLTTGLGVELEL